jgi:hypothetical protein
MRRSSPPAAVRCVREMTRQQAWLTALAALARHLLTWSWYNCCSTRTPWLCCATAARAYDKTFHSPIASRVSAVCTVTAHSINTRVGCAGESGGEGGWEGERTRKGRRQTEALFLKEVIDHFRHARVLFERLARPVNVL